MPSNEDPFRYAPFGGDTSTPEEKLLRILVGQGVPENSITFLSEEEKDKISNNGGNIVAACNVEGQGLFTLKRS